MNRHWRIALAMLLALALLGIAACSDDDNGGTNPPPAADPWIGTWLSADGNVAPLLAFYFNMDSVRVVFNENLTVSLASHDTVTHQWSTNTGTYLVDPAQVNGIHAITTSYSSPAFEQAGIVQVIADTPDTLKLEVVQTVPDIGAVPRTPQTGFGSDPTLLNSNIQIYVREQ
jgi:hypothetical protein